MFKHIKSISVLSLILFLGGVFCLIFSLNEINTVTAENSGSYDSAVENHSLKKIIITGTIPLSYEWSYGSEFKVEAANINPENIEILEDDGELHINYEIKRKNMDQLFLPLIGYVTDTRPLIKITIPQELAVAECIDNSKNYYFNLDLMKVVNSRYNPDTKVEIMLDDAANVTTAYIDPTYNTVYGVDHPEDIEVTTYIYGRMEAPKPPKAPEFPIEEYTTVYDESSN